MFAQSLALAFGVRAEPPVLAIARLLAAELAADRLITRKQISQLLTEQFGGSDAQGRWSVRDAHAVLELAQVLWVQGGTGAGKGRQVASVILDRWVRGERRHIWISKNEALLEDARRDWAALGGLPIDIQPLGTWKLGQSIPMRDGILFVTYPALRSGRSDATRLDQLLAWAGEDFSGVIVFDEAHAMANAAGG